jgi:hypothetical protein
MIETVFGPVERARFPLAAPDETGVLAPPLTLTEMVENPSPLTGVTVMVGVKLPTLAV